MDPELYRNSLSSRFNNADNATLMSEQASLTQGLGLGGTFSQHTGLANAVARSFGPLPGYAGHALHMSQHQESHLQNIAAQGGYKSHQINQPTITDPYAGLRLNSAQGTNSTKPMFTQEVMPQTTSFDTVHKSWNLSNYVTNNPPVFSHSLNLPSTDFLTMVGQQPLNPPPAHSSKSSGIVQRPPFSGTDLYMSRFAKSPPVQNLYDHCTNQDQLVFSSSDMNYEAVSPATTPEHHSQQHQNDTYLSLQDLASISSTQQKLKVNAQTIQKSPTPIVPSRQNKMQRKQQKPLSLDMFSGSQMRRSPQQSPVNIESPHMQIGSPQTSLPSSAIAPPPIQAPADSTTKPKKSRSRKKKDASANDIKVENVARQTYSQQNMLNSADITQRVNGNDFMSNQQVYLQENRNQHIFGSNNMSDAAHNAPVVSSVINQSYGKGQNQQGYAKNVPSPSLAHHPPTSSSNRPPSQQSPMLSGSFQHSPSNNQSVMTYSVSDALEMSREAVFSNQIMVDGYVATDMSPYSMQESFTSQLGMDNMRRQEIYTGAEDGVFGNNVYGGQFVSPNSVLHMEIGIPTCDSQSTIDEAAFSSLMVDTYSQDSSQDPRELSSDNMPYYSLTVKVEASQDEDLSHLAQPITEKKDVKTKNSSHCQIGINHTVSEQHHLQPPLAPKPVVKNSSSGTSFIESYLSFLQGKKPETLSSMSSAIIQNKPQLPKYIPEPPRPKRVEPPPETIVVKTENLNLENKLPPKPVTVVQSSSYVSFSDSEGTDDVDDSAIENAINARNIENDNVKICTNQSGGLTMKINLSKVKKAEENARNKAKQKKVPRARSKKNKEKKLGFKNTFRSGHSFGTEGASKVEEESVPARQLAARKAKENKAKYHISDDSDSDTLKPIRKLGEKSDDDEPYDSDRDPAWTPFSVEKKTPAYDATEFDGKKRKKTRVRRSSTKIHKTSGEHLIAGQLGATGDHVVKLNSDSEKEQQAAIPSVTDELQVGEFVMETKDLKNTESYPIWKIESGRMLHKFELFTENSKILHKSIPTLQFTTYYLCIPTDEPDVICQSKLRWSNNLGNPVLTYLDQISKYLSTDKRVRFSPEGITNYAKDKELWNLSVVVHMLPKDDDDDLVFSSWLPSMKSGFTHVRVRTVFKQGDKEHVEVLDEYRPKPVLDNKLEQKYEDHPLVNVFNIYLQIFLSQALEPGFLSAIRQANERFYLDALDKIDAVVDKQLEEIDAKVKWVNKFKEAVMLRPHIREINQPNLKQPCQACEFANQPAIKSVHLFGNSYNRFTLQELPPDGPHSSQEFLVGKTAAKYVKPYHNLYHFKYNIFKRCLAKVNILHDANAGDNAAILDQCLQNRTWVLQIFEDLKKLLEKG